MAFAIEGFATVAQNHISRNIASNFYPKLPFLSALGAFTLARNNKTALNIGRPKAGEVLSGRVVSPAEVMNLDGFNAYQPRIQRFETSNSKWMGKYDTTPTVANPTTNAHSQAMQASALFYRCRLKTPILIWHEDKNRALQKESRQGKGIAMAQLIDEATEIAYQEHVKELNDKIFNGNPTDQTADPWDQPLGILQALDTANVYGNVNRALPSNAAWRAQKDTTLKTANIKTILDDANVTKRLRVLGPGTGADLIVTTPSLYLTFKDQVRANGGVVLQNGIPEYAKFGYKQEVLQMDNAYIIYDESVPANNVFALTMATWRFAIKPGKNLTVSKFVDLSDKTEGAKEADQAFIETEFIFSCDNPFLNVRHTAIGT